MKPSARLTPWWVTEGLGKYAKTNEILALRARVAKLEAALKSIWEQDDGGMGRIARAALDDKPSP